MNFLALEDPTGGRLSVLPFASLEGANADLEWRYPATSVQRQVDPRGHAHFTVASSTGVVTDSLYPQP